MRRWTWIPGASFLLLYSGIMLGREYGNVTDFYVMPTVLGFASTLVTALYFCVIPAINRSRVTTAMGSVLAFVATGLAGAAIVNLWQYQRMSGESIFQQSVDVLFPTIAAGILAVVVIVRLASADSHVRQP